MNKEPKENPIGKGIALIGAFALIIGSLVDLSKLTKARYIDNTQDIPRIINKAHISPTRYKNSNLKNIHTNTALTDSTELRTFSHNQLTSEELNYLNEPKTFSISHYIVIPDNKITYKKIFDKEVNSKEIDKIRNVKEKLETHNNIYISESNDNKLQLKEFISNSESEFITWTGHNENGYLILPNGSKIQIDKISEMCIEFKKRCIFISCKSNKYINSSKDIGVNVDLSFFDAEKLIQKINQKSQQNTNEKISYDNFSLFISEELDIGLSSIQFNTKVKYHIKKTGKVSVIGGISYGLNNLLERKQENSQSKFKK